MALSMAGAAILIESRMSDALDGDAEAFFDLGLAYSSGGEGAELDLVQAHKWFNLAAMAGDERGLQYRAEVSECMSASEVAEAQRQARAWLNSAMPRAA